MVQARTAGPAIPEAEQHATNPSGYTCVTSPCRRTLLHVLLWIHGISQPPAAPPLLASIPQIRPEHQPNVHFIVGGCSAATVEVRPPPASLTGSIKSAKQLAFRAEHEALYRATKHAGPDKACSLPLPARSNGVRVRPSRPPSLSTSKRTPALSAPESPKHTLLHTPSHTGIRPLPCTHVSPLHKSSRAPTGTPLPAACYTKQLSMPLQFMNTLSWLYSSVASRGADTLPVRMSPGVTCWP